MLLLFIPLLAGLLPEVKVAGAYAPAGLSVLVGAFLFGIGMQLGGGCGSGTLYTMGQGQVYKNDIETWMPSRGSYGETHSASRFYEFQARRLMLRYRDGAKKVHYGHTLNNTVIASPRILIPLIELHQSADGTITIPRALRPYMGGRELPRLADLGLKCAL